MKRLFLLLAVLSQVVYAQSFNFNLTGEKNANLILENYAQKEYKLEDVSTVAYFYEDKVIGIIKHSAFYSLEGYKLIVLKNNNGNYVPIKCEINFDNTKEIVFDGKQVTYYKILFDKNKKCKAVIKDDKVKTSKSLNDVVTSNKMQKIEKFTNHTHGKSSNNIELSDFKTSPQRSVRVKYNNLNDKTKHYLDMK